MTLTLSALFNQTVTPSVLNFSTVTMPSISPLRNQRTIDTNKMRRLSGYSILVPPPPSPVPTPTTLPAVTYSEPDTDPDDPMILK
jgi:hypothetical protein